MPSASSAALNNSRNDDGKQGHEQLRDPKGEVVVHALGIDLVATRSTC